MNFRKYFLLVFSICYFLPSMASASIPTWRILWIILPRVNVTHTDGITYNFTLTQDEITKIREMSRRVERFIEESTSNAVDIEMTVVESTGTVRSLTENTTQIFVGEDDFPSDIKRELEYADEKGRPYHIKVATFRLDGDNEKITSWFGLGNVTYARVHFFEHSKASDFEESATSPHPEEVWVHELLHCFESIFESLGTMAGLHDNDKYGYEYNNGWYRWYHDILAGQVRDPSTGEFVGIQSDMWHYLPPRRIEYWKGHTYKILDTVRSWSGAKDYCEALGGHLVTITSEAEQEVVSSLLKQVATWNYFGYWMGAQRDAQNPAKWHWLTGEAFKYTKFSDGQPDGSGNYLQMYNYPDQGNWDDTTVDANVKIQDNLYPRGIICEWEYILKPSVSILTENHLPSGVINTNYTHTLTTNGASTLTCISGILPNGLTLSTSGLLSGIPIQSGSFDFTVKAENASEYDLRTFTLEITPELVAPLITTINLKDASVNTEYYQCLENSGFSAAWSIIDQYLPANLNLSQTGEITGTPLAEGNYEFTVRAENSAGYYDKTFTLRVINDTFPPTDMEHDEDETDIQEGNNSTNPDDQKKEDVVPPTDMEHDEGKTNKQEDNNSINPDEQKTNNHRSESNKSGGGGCNSAQFGLLVFMIIVIVRIRIKFV